MNSKWAFGILWIGLSFVGCAFESADGSDDAVGFSQNKVVIPPAADVCEGVSVDPVSINVDGDLSWRFAVARPIDQINPIGKLLQVTIKENDVVVFSQTLDGSLLTYNSNAKVYTYQGAKGDAWQSIQIKRHAANRTAIQLRIQGLVTTGPNPTLDPNLFTKSIGFQIGNTNFSVLSDEWQRSAAGAWRLTDTGIPDQAFCATHFQNDPAWVKWATKPGALDHFHLGALMPTVPFELDLDRPQPLTVNLLDKDGNVLGAWSLDLKKFSVRSTQGKLLYFYDNKSAKTAGGIARLILNPHGGKGYQIQFSAYGNLKSEVNPTGGLLEIRAFVDRTYTTPLTQWSALAKGMGYQLRKFMAP